MTSEELAGYAELFIKSVQERVLGIGHDQYAEGDQQRFEKMDLDDLFDYASEELQDLPTYALMLQIRLWRLQAELQAKRREVSLQGLQDAAVQALVRRCDAAEGAVHDLRDALLALVTLVSPTQMPDATHCQVDNALAEADGVLDR